MPLPLTLVTFRVTLAGGAPDIGARVRARLNRYDVDADFGYVQPEDIEETSDANGEGTLALWPNERGSTESWYEVKIEGSERTVRVSAVVPSAGPVTLEQCSTFPPYPGRNEATTAAGFATQALDAAAIAADGKVFAIESMKVATHVGPTPPVATADVPLVDGRKWLNSDTGKRYTYFNDGTSQQWVEDTGFYYVDDPVSVAAAQTARTGAEQARDITLAARDVTTGARDVTTAARDTATAANIAAQAAKTAAEAARDGANTSARAYTSAQGTAAALADAAVLTGQTFSVVAADNLSFTVYRKDAGPVATAMFTQYTKAYTDAVFKKQAEGVAAQAMRLKDASGRIILEVSADASVGITPRVPVSLPAGSVTTAMLDSSTQQRLPTALVDAVVGYALRIKDAAGKLVFGLPTDASKPIAAYVSRAATADSGGAVVAETTSYYVEAFADGAGVMQLRARRKLDNVVVWTTSGTQGSSSPAATPDGKVIYLKGGLVYSVDPADGVSYPAVPTTDLVLFGDSMTAPGSGYGDNMPALFPTRATYNQGIGGQRTSAIAVRFGAAGLTLAVTGNSIPTAGSVACTPNISLLANSGNATQTCRVIVGGVLCDLTITAGSYILTPVVYPGSPVAVANPAPATVTTGFVGGTSGAAATPLSTYQTGIVIIRAGKNDVTKVDYDKTATLAWIASMVDAIKSRAKAVLVMGVTNGYADLPVSLGGTASSDAISDGWLTSIADFNTSLASIYGSRFLDPQANHVALGGSTLQTVNGKNFQVLNNTVLSDGTHENATGKANTAALVQAAINSKGY